MTLGRRIKFLRQQLQMTQGQLAIYSNTDQSYLSRIERDKHPDISYRVIARIAYALHVPLGSLLTEAGIPVRPNPRRLSPELSLLLDAIAQIEPAARRERVIQNMIALAHSWRDYDTTGGGQR
jgi:transcriptional regulator with XRE-family HTH domain